MSTVKILDELTAGVNAARERNTRGKVYSENDCFRVNGKDAFTVLDFWKYKFSQIESCPASLAEFLVAKALDVTRAENLDYWTAYDMSYRGRRIEVKETRYIHSWNREKVSPARYFSIAPSNNGYWSNIPKLHPEKKKERQSDVYVFCLNTNQDYTKADPMNVDDWRFYIVPTFEIDRYADRNGNSDQKKISLSVVRRLAGDGVDFNEIKEKVNEAIKRVDQFLSEL